ncbi:MAG: DUF3291 domain-containing protein [Bacteroidota bacterium]
MKDKNDQNQLVTLTLFRFEGFSNRFWAFKMMQLGHRLLKNVAGLTFYKLMGTGAGVGFKWYPNFGVYSFLGVWEDKDHFDQFKINSKFFRAYQSHFEESLTIHMQAYHSHGDWSGQNPFKSIPNAVDSSVTAVITRATINPFRLIAFWKRVGKVGQQVKSAPGHVLSLGVGEWPVVQQATFSIWNSQSEMKAYAYSEKHHKDVITRTRKYNWYNEELFARFVLLGSEGSWYGEDPVGKVLSNQPTA